MKKTFIGVEDCPTRFFLDRPIAYNRFKIYRLSAEEWNTTFPISPCVHESYRLNRLIVPKGERIKLSKSSMVEFDADCTFSVFGDHSVWMSDTPMETLSHSAILARARGSILVAGLGMGWVVWKLAQKPSVREIVVVEEDRDIVEMIWKRLLPHLGGKRVSLVNTDIWEYRSKRVFDWVWFDIWRYPEDFESWRNSFLWRFRSNCRAPENMRFWHERSVRNLLPARRVIDLIGSDKELRHKVERQRCIDIADYVCRISDIGGVE